jgi:hypothetical protein
MIQKARLVQLAEMDLSVVMLDGQLANDAQEMATELLSYQWRDAKVELPVEYKTVRVKADLFGELTYGIAYYSKLHGDGVWKVCWDANALWEILDAGFEWCHVPPLPE